MTFDHKVSAFYIFHFLLLLHVFFLSILAKGIKLAFFLLLFQLLSLFGSVILLLRLLLPIEIAVFIFILLMRFVFFFRFCIVKSIPFVMQFVSLFGSCLHTNASSGQQQTSCKNKVGNNKKIMIKVFILLIFYLVVSCCLPFSDDFLIALFILFEC